MNPWQTGVSIVDASRKADVMSIELRLDEGSWPTAPLAPATLWAGADGRERAVDLHRLVSLRKAVATFERYGRDDAVPGRGGPFGFIAWWTPDQVNVAGDTTLEWSRRAYNHGDHDHCLLTYDKIVPGETAYVSEDGWITAEAYELFVRDDVIRLRRP